MSQFGETVQRLFLRLFQYRGLIMALSRRELAVRYKGSVLGFLWTFINPIIQLVVYSAVFGSLWKNPTEHYTLYVFGGVLLWGALIGAINDGAAAMNNNSALITKSALPPEIIPARVVLTHFFNYVLTLPLFFLYAFATNEGPSLAWLQMFFFVPLALSFCFSVALGLSILGAMFRDVQYLIGSITFALFFTVPVMYRFDTLPEIVQKVLKFSPFTLLVKINGDILYYRRWVSWKEMLYLVGTVAVIFAASVIILGRYRSRIAERI